MERKIHAAILFTDIKDYSKLPEHLLPAVTKLNDAIRTNIIDAHGPIYVNSWGDAFFVCIASCDDAAEIALTMRDRLRTFNWRKNGFDSPLVMRIGLHFAQITILRSGESINVVGKEINTGSRIEPVVKPGSIFCSNLFKDTLEACNDDRFTFHPLGTKKLAKEFGEMPLFELFWTYEYNTEKYEEAAPPIQEEIYLPHVNRRITDRDKREFTDQTFQEIRRYFQEAAKAATSIDHSVEILVRDVDATRLHVERYRDGDLKYAALFHNSGPFSSYGISFSGGMHLDIHNCNSFNEILSIEENNGALTWRSTLGNLSYYRGDRPYDINAMTPSEVAKYMWERFVDD